MPTSLRPSEDPISPAPPRAPVSPSKSLWSASDLAHMRRALVLSLLGRPSPNPYVGAVIVKAGRVVGEGYHRKAGEPHAEVEAIRDAHRRWGVRAPALLRASTLYVTLEPCNHHGRTPPCCEAVEAAGIGTVVYALADPNPRVKGGGGARLRRAGLRVRSGLLEDEARVANAAFLKHARTGLPLVTLKLAMTLDGKCATRTGDSQWISSPPSLAQVHRMRDRCPAILVGAGTVRSDDPRLTCRLPRGRGHDPLRVVVDGRLSVSPSARVFADPNALVVLSPRAPASRQALFQRRGIDLLHAPASPSGQPDLRFVLRALAARGINHVLCEGGPTLAAAWLEAGLVDEFILCVAPKVCGGASAPGPVGGPGIARMAQARPLKRAGTLGIGPDLWVCSRSRWAAALPGHGLLGPLGLEASGPA